MTNAIGVIFGLTCLILGIRGLFAGKTILGWRTKSPGTMIRNTNHPPTLTGNRALVFNTMTVFIGGIITYAWFAYLQRVDKSSLESAMRTIHGFGFVYLVVIGILCLLWEKQTGTAHRRK